MITSGNIKTDSMSQPHDVTGFDVLVEIVHEESDGVRTLSLVTPDGRPLPGWDPGAHIDLVLDDGLERQYSLCGPRDDRSRWRVAVLRASESRGGSEWVHDRIRAGDHLRVRGPRNKFPLKSARKYLFIAGGIGITPLLPMIEELDATRPETPWTLVYGGRRRESMAFLTELGRFGDKVEIWPEEERGLIDLDTVLGTPQFGTAIYCCGPEPLIKAVERLARSWPPGSLHVERFQAPVATGAESAGQATFEVVATQSGVTAEVPAGQTIVDVLAGYGISIPVSCGEGVCGTCVTKVLEGIPEHRDAVLTEEQRASGEVITPCCSRSKTPRIVLDV
ncbi:PDR/VanB family oxidoreductase [Rhodococcus sp. NPDC019627]|uniref:PDR/VanB family oxidoreductase n=1 Tax=unclassified Rhodococcus (in: high G+C Gram-positive bacteria) TaxID=192944 RepID=UPI0033EF4509